MLQQKELAAQKKELLQRAIELENFEEAAVLRDEIRQLEGGQKDGSKGKMV
nr:UvrB/UvrC motif-containing protein [Hydrogeniiclostridium mannosilyticum]